MSKNSTEAESGGNNKHWLVLRGWTWTGEAGPVGCVSIVTHFTPLTAVPGRVELTVLEVGSIKHNKRQAQQCGHKCYNLDVCCKLTCVTGHQPHISLCARHTHRRVRCSYMAHTEPWVFRPALCKSRSCTSAQARKELDSLLWHN